MADTVTLVSTDHTQRFLSPGENFSVEFTPAEGEGVAWANRVGPGVVFALESVFGGPRPTFEEAVADILQGGGGLPDLPPSVTLGGIRIEIFRPGFTAPLRTLDTEDFTTDQDPKNRLPFAVSAGTAGQTWSCRFTNITQEDSTCLAHVQFPDEEVSLVETRISQRLLNRTLREFLLALGLQVFAHDSVGLIPVLISVSQDISHLTDGVISQARFSFNDDSLPLFTDVSTVRLDTDSLVATAGRDNQSNTPVLRIEAGFDTDISGGSFEIFGAQLTGVEIRRINIALEFSLFASNPLADRVGNVVIPIASVDVDVEGDQGLLTTTSLSDVAGDIEDRLLAFFRDQEIRRAVVRYLTQGIMGLVQRDHVFWSISADASDYIVEHFAPPTDSIVDSFGLDDAMDGGSVISQPPGSGSSAGSGTTAGTVPENAGLAGGPGTTSGATAGTTVSTMPPSSGGTTTVIAASGPERALANLDKIEHIVVLMMENRSFDHMLGYLTVRGGRNDIDGLTGNEANVVPDVLDAQGNPTEVTVRELRRSLFKYSPHHEHEHVLRQIANGSMGGFVADFLSRFSAQDPQWAMGYYTEELVPVYDFLARNYTICDRWFSSHPGPTWPNRLCTLTGQTPQLNNYGVSSPMVGYLREPTIFDVLTANGISWAYHEHDVSFLRMFDRYRLDDTNVLPFSRDLDVRNEYAASELFISRAESGSLPAVTFIDPNFVDIPPFATANDDHPPADIANGQELIRQIYNALVGSPQWERILFVVTYDEHGGFFDHVAPPGTALSAEGENTVPQISEEGPAFYGVRVPTFVVSPWVTASGNSTIFDHTSIIKTILLKFNDGNIPAHFGERVRQANHLGPLLSRNNPRLQVPTIAPVTFSTLQLLNDSEIAVSEEIVNDFHDVIQRFAVPIIA